jgi:hypothetical protein
VTAGTCVDWLSSVLYVSTDRLGVENIHGPRATKWTLVGWLFILKLSLLPATNVSIIIVIVAGKLRVPGRDVKLFYNFINRVHGIGEKWLIFVMSVWPSTWKNSAPTGRFLMKFDVRFFLKNVCQKFKFYYNLTRITDTLREDVSTFVTISRRIPLRMKNVSYKSYRGNQNTHFMLCNFFFEIRAAFEIMWKNVVKPDRPPDDRIIRRIRFACWITKAADTRLSM